MITEVIIFLFTKNKRHIQYSTDLRRSVIASQQNSTFLIHSKTQIKKFHTPILRTIQNTVFLQRIIKKIYLMTEDLLQFLWQHRLYNTSNKLLNTDGESIEIIFPGILNHHAGPDFLEAKIKVAHTTWVGNIEIHLKTSDWNKHHHNENSEYDKLILHVVYLNDIALNRNQKTQFMTLELKNHIDPTLIKQYETLMEQKSFIPCEKLIQQVPPLSIMQQMNRVLAERLEEKTHSILELLSNKNNNWQEVFYINLAKGFGSQINQYPFQQLAQNTPLNLIAKLKSNPLQIEALLFGQAGFLNEYFDEDYPILLQNEYQYLKKIHQLKPMDKNLWKFLRLRPANFPTIRIAQFSQLILQSTHLFSKILNAQNIQELLSLFQVHLSQFWETHYTLYDSGNKKEKHLGISFTHTLIINSIIPTLFIYGKLQGREEFCNIAIELLNELPAEKNHIITKWSQLGLKMKHASDTQSALQLYHKYCLQKKCLHCSIGFKILKQSK